MKKEDCVKCPNSANNGTYCLWYSEQVEKLNKCNAKNKIKGV